MISLVQFLQFYEKEIEDKIDRKEYHIKRHKFRIDINEHYYVQIVGDLLYEMNDSGYIIRLYRYYDPVEYSKKIKHSVSSQIHYNPITNILIEPQSISNPYSVYTHTIPWVNKAIDIWREGLTITLNNPDKRKVLFDEEILSDLRKEKIKRIVADI